MADEGRPGQGSRPGIETQNTATGLGKPAQVPRDPASPNAEPFDASPEAEALRARVDDGAGDRRAGAGDLGDPSEADAVDAGADAGDDAAGASNPSPS